MPDDNSPPTGSPYPSIRMGFEALIDQKIREAERNGAFDSLPGLGKPLTGLDEPYREDWWIKQWMARENLSAGPEVLELRSQAEKLLAAIPALPSELMVQKQVKAVNDIIRKANALPADAALRPLPMLDEAAVLARWKAQR